MTKDRLLTPKEAAGALSCAEITMLRYLRSGKLPGVKTPGGHWRIRESDLDKYIENLPKQNKKPIYCSRPSVDSCEVCSLVSYGRDCMNNPVIRGEKHDG